MTYSAIVAFDYKNFCPSLSRTDTKTMTIQDIQKEVDEICVWFDQMWPMDKSMVDKHIPVSWMKRSSAKSVGRTYRRRIGGVYKGVYTYTIELNRELLTAMNPVGFHSTILHECLHCVESVNRDGWSHTGLWKERAIKLSNITPFDIKRTVQRDEVTPEYQKILMSKYKYNIVCECGWSCPRQRMSKPVKEIASGKPYGYYCPKCGSKNLKVINLV